MVADVERTLEMSSSEPGDWLRPKMDCSSEVEAAGTLRYSLLIRSRINLLRL